MTPGGFESVGKERKGGGGEQRPAGVVQKGPVGIYLVPDEQRTTERVVVQNRQGRVRQVQVWGGDDRDTRGGRVSGIEPGASAEGGSMEGVERGPRGAGGK